MFKKVCFIFAAFAASTAMLRAEFAPIGGLDLVSSSSTFETGREELLPSRGWVNASGSARIFDHTNGALIGTSQYGNYAVRHDTGVTWQPNVTYRLTVDMGFIAAMPGGNVGYSMRIGRWSNSTFTTLAMRSGSVSYAGNMNDGIYSANDVSLLLLTGNAVVPGNIFVQLAQDGRAPSGSDFFGFDNVLLEAEASPVPEPGTWAVVGIGLVAVFLMSKRARNSFPPLVAICMMAPAYVAAQPTAAVQELKELRQAETEAEQRKDIAWLDRHTDDQFIWITRLGSVIAKPDLLKRIRQGNTLALREPAKTTIEDEKYRLFGDTAVVTTISRRESGSTVVRFASTQVYMKRNARWVAVSAHTHVIPTTDPVPKRP